MSIGEGGAGMSIGKEEQNMGSGEEEEQAAGVGRYLTKRELNICYLVSKGLTNRQIAQMLYYSEGYVKMLVSSIVAKAGVHNRAELAAIYAKILSNVETNISNPAGDAAIKPEWAGLRLRLVGHSLSGLPEMIPIILRKRPFVIGRHDPNIGHKQCDFEFNMDAKAVSRRHAEFERTDFGVAVNDLDSQTGTYVNGIKVTPGMPHNVQLGDRVSFGNAGADYILEE